MVLKKLRKYCKSLQVSKASKSKVTEVSEEKNREALKNMHGFLEKQMPEESQTIRNLEKLKKLVFATPTCDYWGPDIRKSILDAIYLLEESENKQKALLDEAVKSLESFKNCCNVFEDQKKVVTHAISSCIDIVNSIKYTNFGVDKKEMLKVLDVAISCNFVQPKNYKDVLMQVKHLVERQEL